MIKESDIERFRDKYSNWQKNLNEDIRAGVHLTGEDLQAHLESKAVKDDCEYLGITIEAYKKKYIIFGWEKDDYDNTPIY